MRADSLALAKSSAALKLLCVLIAWRHRDHDGGLASAEPLNLPVAKLATAIALPRSTTADAIKTLLAKKMLMQNEPQSGRRARSLELTSAYRKLDRHALREKQNSTSLGGREPPAPLPVPDTKGLPPTGEAKTRGSIDRSVRQGNTLK
jgi:DNA-binding MarR family transcriptional regulator